jgi:hypothetical protein
MNAAGHYPYSLIAEYIKAWTQFSSELKYIGSNPVSALF